MTFDEWIAEGIRQGWATAPVCATHDGFPMTDEEAEEDDICIHMIRLCESPEQQAQIQRDHSPASWRRSNLGL